MFSKERNRVPSLILKGIKKLTQGTINTSICNFKIFEKRQPLNIPISELYHCPCCGYFGLDAPPYKNMPPITKDIYKLKPPYGIYWGMGSYDVCPCCAFEYGADDDPPETWPKGYTFQEFLVYFITKVKCQWMEPEKKPLNWDLKKQLEDAGIPVPDILK